MVDFGSTNSLLDYLKNFIPESVRGLVSDEGYELFVGTRCAQLANPSGQG